MKHYETYKDSGIAWIGEIPSEWEVCSTKHLFNLYSGATPKTDNDSFWDGNIPWITPADFKTEDVYISKGRRSITQNGVDSCGTTIVPANSVIFSKRAPIGLVVLNKEPLCTNQGCISCVPKEASSKYYYYAMSVFTDSYELYGSGTTFMEISATSFANFQLPNPSINEQQSIATFLDTKCGEIDALISLQEEMTSELQAYKQSVITETVTKGLNPNAKMKDSGVEWIGEIPEEWNICKAKFLVNISHGMDPVTDGDIPVYGSGADSFKTCGEYKEGDAVLIGRKGATLHIPHYIKGRYWNVDTAFDVKAKDNFHLRYYYYNAICFDYKKYMSQTTLPGMTQSNYNNMKLPCPPLHEQHFIATYLDEKTSQIDSLIALKQQKIEELKDYKKSIIYEYVTGKKRV